MMLRQVFCIFLFMGAASIFGTLVSQINEIVASQTTISKELDKVLEVYFSIQPRQVMSSSLSNSSFFSIESCICCLTQQIH
mmetsp:Transcript_40552/g.84695  ORF Transcript_40552/g.84695 Transcript_40552/m.84695 type:complete len:81 (+) Transcript_40552:157-399(+)